MPFDSTPETKTYTQHPDLYIFQNVLKNLYQEDSWVKGTLSRGEARCAIGWIANEFPKSMQPLPDQVEPLARHIFSANRDILYRIYETFNVARTPLGAIMCYNDLQSTTKDDIIRLFENTVAYLSQH